MTNKPLFGPASPKQQMILESKAQILVIGGAAGCFSHDTEYLSQDGWKKFSEYKEGDLVCQYNYDKDSICFVEPEEYIKIPCEELTEFSAKGVDQCLSEEHRVYYWPYKNSKKPKILPFHEVKRRHEASKTKGWTGNFKTTFNSEGRGMPLSEGQLRLQVAIHADGRIVKEGKDNYTQMRFSKKRKYDRLISLCKTFGLPYKDNGSRYEPQYSNDTAYEVIVWAPLRSKTYSPLFYSCSQEQLKIITDEVRYWDGSVVKNASGSETVRYFSRNKEDADFIQFAFASQGLNTCITKDEREKYTNAHYTVNGFETGKGFRSIANKDGKIEMKPFKTDGFKYCFSVPSGALLVRRNDKIAISGNSGKSYLLQLMPLMYIDDPKTTCVMFRRTTPQITGAGGLWLTAKGIYNSLPKRQKPRIREKALEFIFPTGAQIKYQHMQTVNDKYDIQGLQYTFIGVDEACQFEWEQLEYMMSRLRSESKYPSRMVMSCNPDPDHKIKELIQWHLDDEGYPIPERDGQLRYFVQLDGEIYWGFSEQELKDKFGEKCLPLSFSFISATITDNPPMMENNPTYEAFLDGLNPTDKARLRYGNWEARPEGANYFQRSWLMNADKIPSNARFCRGWDKAGTERTTENKHPDFTASIKMYRDINGYYYLVGDYHEENHDDVTDTRGRFCKKAGSRDQIILKQAQHDGSDCIVVFPIDPAQAGKLEFTESSRKLVEEGFVVKSDPTPNNKSKLTKFSPFASAAESGLVYIVRRTFDDRTYEAIMKELESFDGTRSTTSRKDDYVDAVSACFSFLSQTKQFKAFSIPSINAPTRLHESRVNI